MVIRWAVAQASFRTPNWSNALPGDAYEGDELVEYFEGRSKPLWLRTLSLHPG